jgi:hypothetical protein
MSFGNDEITNEYDDQKRALLDALMLNHGPGFGPTFFTTEGRKALSERLRRTDREERSDSDLSVAPEGGSI